MGVLFDEPVDVSDNFNIQGGYDLIVDGVVVGEARSQTWSFRYKKYMMYAMFDLSYIRANDVITVNGQDGSIHPLSLFKAALEGH